VPLSRQELDKATTLAAYQHVERLFEVLMDDWHPNHDKEVNEEAVRNYAAGIRHLSDVFDLADEENSKL
jgi:hypothetical protein